MPAAEGTLLSPDGVPLFYRRWDAFQPRAVCFLVHGLAEHSGRYEPLAQLLVRRRFFVWAMDHRGHGRSGGLPADCTGLDQLVDDLRGLIRKAAEAMPHLPRILIGHSLGGLIALSYAARHADEIRAVAVSSPALKLKIQTPPWKIHLVTATSRIFPTFPFQNGVDPKRLSSDPAVIEAYKRDPLIHRALTARCAVGLDRDMRDSLRWANRLRVPCLILQAGSDTICDPAASETFAQSVRGAPMTFRRYEGLSHELFNEPQRDVVIGDLIRWIEGLLQ